MIPPQAFYHVCNTFSIASQSQSLRTNLADQCIFSSSKISFANQGNLMIEVFQAEMLLIQSSYTVSFNGPLNRLRFH